MGRKLGIAIATSVVAVGLILGMGGGSAAGGKALLSHQDGETIVLIGRPVNELDVDLGKHGFGPGDMVVFRDRVFDESGTEQVGRLNGQCTVNFPTTKRKVTFNCYGSLTLVDQGQIMFQGVATFRGPEPPTFTFGLVGGTEHFLDVRGDVDVELLEDGERFTLNLMA